MIGGALVFFYSGGSGFFRRLQKQKGLLPPPKPVANGNVTATGTPIAEKNFVLPPSLDKVVPPPAQI